MHCSSCGASVSKQGEQQTASMKKSGGSTSENKFHGVPVSIKDDIQAFFNKQYQAITYPEAGTTETRLALNSYTIALLNAGQIPQCQLSIVFQSGNKTSAGSPDTVVPAQTDNDEDNDKKALSPDIQNAITDFINGLYKIIGDTISGTSRARHLLANWVNEILNEDQASTCWMSLAVGSDTQTPRHVYDQYFSASITGGLTTGGLPIQQSVASRAALYQEEKVCISAQLSSDLSGAVSESTDAAQVESEERHGIVEKAVNTDGKFATGSGSVHNEDEEDQCIEVEDQCVGTSDSMLERVSDISGTIKRSQSLEEGYWSFDPNSKASEILGLPFAEQESEKLELDISLGVSPVT